jgi:hypothetical protein
MTWSATFMFIHQQESSLFGHGSIDDLTDTAGNPSNLNSKSFKTELAIELKDQ